MCHHFSQDRNPLDLHSSLYKKKMKLLLITLEVPSHHTGDEPNVHHTRHIHDMWVKTLQMDYESQWEL